MRTTRRGSDNLRAALLVIASGALFAVGDATVKYLSDRWPIGEIVALRSLLCLPLLALLRRRGEPFIPAAIQDPANLGRAACEVGVTFFYFAGVSMMPLGNASTILFLAPVVLTAVAGPLLGERVGWRRWLAVALGFVGVLIVMRPRADGWSVVALLPLTSTFFIAGRDVIVRRLQPAITTRTVVLTTSLALLLAGLVSMLFDARPVGPALLLGAAFCALLVTTALLCYVEATRMAEVSFLQPFRYTSLPYAFLLGFLIWGDRPTVSVLLGGLLIVISGLVIFSRERRLAGAASPSQ
jgi:drug/metabolite transporter (DMT)-like permease